MRITGKADCGLWKTDSHTCLLLHRPFVWMSPADDLKGDSRQHIPKEGHQSHSEWKEQLHVEVMCKAPVLHQTAWPQNIQIKIKNICDPKCCFQTSWPSQTNISNDIGQLCKSQKHVKRCHPLRHYHIYHVPTAVEKHQYQYKQQFVWAILTIFHKLEVAFLALCTKPATNSKMLHVKDEDHSAIVIKTCKAQHPLQQKGEICF